MWAGHCPWSEFTDQNVCNIYDDELLASRYHAMLRFGTFSKFATMATCQYWEVFPEEEACCLSTFGNMPKIVGTLPKVPHLTIPGPEWTHT